MAELGCYRGDTSWQLNVLMPDRKLYLFDTFEGSMNGMLTWNEAGCSTLRRPVFRDRQGKLMERMPCPDRLLSGRAGFPKPPLTLKMKHFVWSAWTPACTSPPWPAGIFLSPHGRGGVILLSGCSGTRYRGVAKAVEDLETRYGALLMLPVGDLDGTVMIVHP